MRSPQQGPQAVPPMIKEAQQWQQNVLKDPAGQPFMFSRPILRGGGAYKEKLIKTPGGFKEGRRPDILYRTPSGELRGVNVGRRMADGSPVPREVEALADLNRVYPTTFLPYN